MVALPLVALAALCATVPDYDVTYMRVPKSGSTTMMHALSNHPKIRVHDHGDGCRVIRECNGSTVSGISVVALRNPYIRFESQLVHLAQRNTSMLDVLRRTHCVDPTSDCIVREINAIYTRSHRVIFWPQSLWIGASSIIVCVSSNPATTIDRWARVLAAFDIHIKHSSMRKNALDHPNPNVAHRHWVERYYKYDLELWDRFCMSS